MFQVFNPDFADRVRLKRAKLARLDELRRIREEQKRVRARRAKLAAPVGGRPLAANIIKLVAEEHGLTERDLLSKRRDRKVCEVRKLAIASVIHQRPDMSITLIARAFNRDHSTILQTMGNRYG